MLSDDGAELI